LVGINSIELDETSQLAKVYPNPTTNFITVQLSGTNKLQVNYSVSDICGRVMKSGLVGFSNKSIDFTAFPKGLYVVKLSDGVKHQFVKIVKD
jgi:hypothetical protein